MADRFCVAIHPDQYTRPGIPDRKDDSSPIWAEYLQNAGHQVKWVDIQREGILDELRGCHGFMWRWAHFDGMSRIAMRLLPILENQLGMVVYPNQNTCWHYDDKIRQYYLFSTLGIPTPRTWISYDEEDALRLTGNLRYPVVLKLAGGARSGNVRLIENRDQAQRWIHRLFRCGVHALSDGLRMPLRSRVRAVGKIILKALPPALPLGESHRGYVLFQEFLPDNDYDTRITVIGRRAFGYRRFNRPNDFRASGSGNFDVDPSKVDPHAVRLAFDVAALLKSQSLAMDILRRGDESLLLEVSYTYVSWMVHACPGHWELAPETDAIGWVEGRMLPEVAQVEDFVAALGRPGGADCAVRV